MTAPGPKPPGAGCSAWSLAPEQAKMQRRPVRPATKPASSVPASDASNAEIRRPRKPKAPLQPGRRRPARPYHATDVSYGSHATNGRPPRIAPVAPPPAPPDPAAAEEARERRSMERFLSLLEKNPRRGTALDRVYGYHVERGTLDAFIKSLPRPPRQEPQRRHRLADPRPARIPARPGRRRRHRPPPGRDHPARRSPALLTISARPSSWSASPNRPPPPSNAHSSASPPATTCSRSSRPWAASTSAPRRTTRPSRSGTASKPSSPTTRASRSRSPRRSPRRTSPPPALPRFEALAKKATDPFRQVQLAMQAADLKVRLGRSDEALHDFEAMLGKLRPDSWLHREVRRKIEEVFLRNDDQAGLVAYYEQWTKKEPEDVEALVRLGRTLAGMGRAAEAQAWYEKADQARPQPPRPAAGPDLPARPGPEVRRGRRAVRGPRPGRAQQPRHAPRLGRPGPARHHQARSPSARPPRPPSGASCSMPSPTTRSPPPRSPTCCARPSWSTRPWPSTARPPSWPRPTPSITNTSANTSTSSSGPTRPRPPGPRSPTGPTGTPRTWPGWPRSWPASAT